MIEVKPEHLHLDRAHLETAILNQASIFDLYATECGKQQNKVDRLQGSLDYTIAKKKLEIRDNAEAAKKKLTLDDVASLVLTDPEVVEAKGRLFDEQEYLLQLKAAVEALRHKRDSIDNEVRLVLSKASLITCDVDPDTKFDAQAEAIDRATRESMAR